MMIPLSQGSIGKLVSRAQEILKDKGVYHGTIDGIYGPKTVRAVVDYQRHASGLKVDGVIGPATAAALGLELSAPRDEYPKPPHGAFQLSTMGRRALFGGFTWNPNPAKNTSGQAIEILDGWEDRNIVSVVVPSMTGIIGPNGKPMETPIVRMHRLVVPQFFALWNYWKANDMLPETFDGMFVARYMRGSSTLLSNHAYGTAFDINCQWNQLGKQPARRGERGSVVDLVESAARYGFYWGGWFSRLDGMHFEVFKLLSASELDALK